MRSAARFDFKSNRKEWIFQKTGQFHAFLKDPLIRAQKFQKMSENPFSFFRGGAYLYYAGIGEGAFRFPKHWLSERSLFSWIQGDSHVQNLGFSDINGSLIFQLNDFDESCVGPVVFDLVRFLSSVDLMRPQLSFPVHGKDLEEINSRFLKIYKQVLDSGENRELTINELDGFLKKKGKKVLRKDSQKKLLKKWTEQTNDGRKFLEGHEKLSDLSTHERQRIFKAWAEYREYLESYLGLNEEIILLDTKKRIKSGLGSMGSLKVYALVQWKKENSTREIILEIKEQRDSSVYIALPEAEIRWHKERFSHEAYRSLRSFQLIHSIKDPWSSTLLNLKEGSLVRRISPYKKGFDPEDFPSLEDLENFLKFSARVLAHAHFRGAIDLENSKAFSKKMTSFLSIAHMSKIVRVASEYARQVESDHQFFLELLEEGKFGSNHSSRW